MVDPCMPALQEPVGFGINLLRCWKGGPNVPDFSLRMSTMRLEIATICSCSPIMLATITYVRQAHGCEMRHCKLSGDPRIM